MKAGISIIIPTYNEADHIDQTLHYLTNADRADCIHQIIVADGKSTDQTRKLAKKAGATVLQCSRKGRAKQMNEAAGHAVADILYFLHYLTI